MAGFFLLAALIISFGNWVDRKTLLKLGTGGLFFKNGLRTVCMNWDEIQSVGVKNIYWGAQRVLVYGQQARFSFQTMGTVSYRGNIQGRTGFPEGEEILEIIVGKSNLDRLDKSDTFDYYYARE